jgi:beta-mannosidase
MKRFIALSKFLMLVTLVAGLPAGLVSQNIDNKNINNIEHNLSSLEWKLWCYRPESWKLDFNFSKLDGTKADFFNIPVQVPGSVQKALKDAGIIEDWNIGNNYINSEWIENRHWIFATKIPEGWIMKNSKIVLTCHGLDDNGVIIVNGKEAGTFNNTFIPYEFDITPFLNAENNTLAIVFKCPPAYLGQIGYTSKI